MDDLEPLGAGTEHHIASCVADGTATPEDARRLLQEFVRQAGKGKVSARMIEHFAACIGAYLEGKKRLLPAANAGRLEPLGVPIQTLEKAFGLKRIAPGQPRTDEDTLAEVAMQVLELLLAGDSVQEACGKVADRRKSREEKVSSDSQVLDAWSTHKLQGCVFLRICRVVEQDPWSPEELRKLNQIFDGIPGAVPAGMTVAGYWSGLLPGEPLPQTIAIAAPKNPQDKPS